MTTPPAFVPGLELSRRFFHEAVRPLVDAAAPGIRYSAARLGGARVRHRALPRPRMGARLELFLRPRDLARHAPAIGDRLATGLPKTFLGHPTHFAATAEAGIRVMAATDGPVRHAVDITDSGTWFTGRLGFDPGRGVSLADWLSAPAQRLAEVTSGAVFHDGLGELTAARARLAWYPHDLWLHVLACQWRRVCQEEAFVGRCGEVGDELGAAVVAARLVRDLMRLCLLMDRRYPPYPKWLGSAFARVPGAARLTPVLRAALAATGPGTRERHLGTAYETVAAEHNRLGLTDPVDPATRPYHGRPFRVLRAERFADALTARITDPAVRALPPGGAVDQFVDSTEVLTRSAAARAVVRSVTGGP